MGGMAEELRLQNRMLEEENRKLKEEVNQVQINSEKNKTICEGEEGYGNISINHHKDKSALGNDVEVDKTSNTSILSTQWRERYDKAMLENQVLQKKLEEQMKNYEQLQRDIALSKSQELIKPTNASNIHAFGIGEDSDSEDDDESKDDLNLSSAKQNKDNHNNYLSNGSSEHIQKSSTYNNIKDTEITQSGEDGSNHRRRRSGSTHSLDSQYSLYSKAISPRSIEIEQLQNIMKNYFMCDQFDLRVQMEPHIMTVLKFTNDDVVKVEEARKTLENFFINPKSWSDNLKNLFGRVEPGKSTSSSHQPR